MSKYSSAKDHVIFIIFESGLDKKEFEFLGENKYLNLFEESRLIVITFQNVDQEIKIEYKGAKNIKSIYLKTSTKF